MALAEADDFDVLLEHLTTPEQQPALHYWRTHPDFFSLSVDEIVAVTVESSRALRRGLVAVILDRLEWGRPAVLEGNYLTPELWDEPELRPHVQAGRVRGALVLEPGREQLLANFLGREPDAGPQALRADVSVAYGRWLAAEAQARGFPVLEARPWHTAAQRLLEVAS
ncbi:hypothetical protein [Deinococcus koreensis]|uniref:hypothetical protein n=1 Tax=Deinococcus koreensis TaxID=2054903 RepID=UPI0013FD86C2|nr:hypothetical protein [Deinococcus koreensis]